MRGQPLINETGMRYGRWIVLGEAGRQNEAAYWLCRCDCSTERIVNGRSLRNGRSQSCGCYRADQRRLENGEAAFNAYYGHIKVAALQRELCFELTKEEVRQLNQMPCHYCGTMPSNTYGRTREWNGEYIYNGLDRVNSGHGYKRDNVVPCCAVCNRMKRDLPLDAFLSHIVTIAQNVAVG